MPQLWTSCSGHDLSPAFWTRLKVPENLWNLSIGNGRVRANKCRYQITSGATVLKRHVWLSTTAIHLRRPDFTSLFHFTPKNQRSSSRVDGRRSRHFIWWAKQKAKNIFRFVILFPCSGQDAKKAAKNPKTTKWGAGLQASGVLRNSAILTLSVACKNAATHSLSTAIHASLM